MGIITPGDKCDVCNEIMVDKDAFKVCPLCMAYICKSCSEKSEEERGNICPCCRRDPSY